MKLAIINGPNLNALGKRETNIYGNENLEDIEKICTSYGKKLGIDIVFFQSNIEGEIINFLYDKERDVEGFIINPGALTHYSYSLRDCIKAIDTPVIEVHISNVEGREEFRKYSVISPVASGKIAGFGIESYLLGISYFNLKNEK